MSSFASWRPALRIAAREVWRAKARSALVIVLVALPVLGVVALDTLYRTAAVGTAEALSRQLGRADALVSDVGADGALFQTPDASGFTWKGDGRPTPLTAAAVGEALPGARVVPLAAPTEGGVRTADGTADVTTWPIDLRDPVTAGLVRPADGRLPRTTGEVTVSSALVDRGLTLGSTLRLREGGTRTIVGVVDSAESRGQLLVTGLPGSLPRPAGPDNGSFLVDVPGSVSWTDVRRANRSSMLVLSRSVVLSPPPADAVPAEVRDIPSGPDQGTITVVALVAAMAVLEVVLLAGPAMAVGARRQQRSHALMRAAGARPRDVRRTVLAGGLVLGGAASVLGAVLGVGAAFLARPAVQQVVDGWFGPFEVSLRDVALILAVGLTSAVLASYVPARLAARLDVVAVLSGRRGDPAPGRRSPVIGLLLLGAGVAAAARGAAGNGGETTIVAGAVLSVLGMVLLVPLALGLAGRTAHRLPLSMRYAVRDAARHRSRTAPAVAAVAATVAGVVALGIGSASDSEQGRRTYAPSGPPGAALVTVENGSAATWRAVGEAARRVVPDARPLPLRGVRVDSAQGWLDITFDPSPTPEGGGYSGGLGMAVAAAPFDLDRLGVRFDPALAPQVRDVLARGGAVVLQRGPAGVVQASLTATRYDEMGEATGRRTVQVPTLFVPVYASSTPVQAVVPDAVLRSLGTNPAQTALLLDGTRIDTETEQRLREAVDAVAPRSGVSVERGPSDDDAALVTLLLGVIGGVLMLGGTLTATFLALADARPDLATLAAVGAAPRRRRAVAASYAVTIAALGAVIGTIVGFVPGLAITYPLTRGEPGGTDLAGQPLPTHFIDVPWLLVLGLLVALPAVTGLLVAALTRSRLPMAARLS